MASLLCSPKRLLHYTFTQLSINKYISNFTFTFSLHFVTFSYLCLMMQYYLFNHYKNKHKNCGLVVFLIECVDVVKMDENNVFDLVHKPLNFVMVSDFTFFVIHSGWLLFWVQVIEIVTTHLLHCIILTVTSTGTLACVCILFKIVTRETICLSSLQLDANNRQMMCNAFW